MACCRQGSMLCCLRCRFLFDNTIVRDKPNLVTCRQASSCPSGKLNGLLALFGLFAFKTLICVFPLVCAMNPLRELKLTPFC